MRHSDSVSVWLRLMNTGVTCTKCVGVCVSGFVYWKSFDGIFDLVQSRNTSAEEQEILLHTLYSCRCVCVAACRLGSRVNRHA